MQQDYDYLFKMLLIGPSGCGKSSILLKYTDNTYSASYISTIGVDFKIKTLVLNDPISGQKKTVKLQIWDTAGQERFRTIVSSYYRGAHACLLVYDISDKDSFDEMLEWRAQMLSYAPTDIKMILVGNKNDISPKKVSTETAFALANEWNIPFMETSALNGTNIHKVFNTLTMELVKQQAKSPKQREIHDQRLLSRTITQKQSSCGGCM